MIPSVYRIGSDITGYPVYLGDFVAYPYRDHRAGKACALALATLPRMSDKSITTVRWDPEQLRPVVGHSPHPLGDVLVVDPFDHGPHKALRDAVPFEYPPGWVPGMVIGDDYEPFDRMRIEFGGRDAAKLLGLSMRLFADIHSQDILPPHAVLHALNNKAERYV